MTILLILLDALFAWTRPNRWFGVPQGLALLQATREHLLTSDEWAKFLGLPQDAIARWSEVRAVPPVRIGRRSHCADADLPGTRHRQSHWTGVGSSQSGERRE